MADNLTSSKRSRSIRDWCRDRGYSITTFYKMQRLGIAPTVTPALCGPPRISDEADAEWLERMNNPFGTLADQIEKMNAARRERARKAATKSVTSPHHVSQRHAARQRDTVE